MNKLYDYKVLLFDVEENTNVTTDMDPAISIDVTTRINENINTLQRIMGITALTPMSAGTTIKIYKGKVTKASTQVAEGEIINLSKYERKLADTITLGLNKYRRLTTAEAIQKVGRDIAINEADGKLVNEVRKEVKNNFFALIKNGTGTSEGGSTLQMACAQAWASLQVYYDDMDVTPIYFVNPLDIATHLGNATLISQDAFGFQYVENFLGMGNAFITPAVTQGTVFATVTENLNGAFVPTNGDVGSTFGLTSDESGFVGMAHGLALDRASVETLLMMGVAFYVEDLAGVFKSAIGA